MSEFAKGILFLRKEISQIADYVKQITEFHCIVNHLNTKWSVLFIPGTVSTGTFCEHLSHKLSLLEFWNYEDHGWGYKIHQRGSIHTEFRVEYELYGADDLGETQAHVDAIVFSLFKVTKKNIILLQEVLTGSQDVDAFKKILNIKEMSRLNHDTCGEDVLDSDPQIEVSHRSKTNTTSLFKEITDLSPFRKNGQYGYINDYGDIVVHPVFDRADFFSNGLGRVTYKGKIGFINTVGEYVIEPEFDWAASFSEDRCVVEKAERAMIINKKGEIFGTIDRSQYTSNWRFSEGMMNVATKDNQYGFMNELGSWVIEPTYREAGHFRDGYAWVTLSTKPTIYIDSKQNPLTIPEGYKVGSAFSEGLAIISKRHSYGVMDRNGTLLLENLPFTSGFFKEGLLSLRFQHQYGYIDADGNIVIDPGFDEAFEFKNGVAMIGIKGKTSFINKNGTLLHKPQKYYNTIMFSVRENAIFKTQYKERFMYLSKLTGEPVYYLEEFDI